MNVRLSQQTSLLLIAFMCQIYSILPVCGTGKVLSPSSAVLSFVTRGHRKDSGRMEVSLLSAWFLSFCSCLADKFSRSLAVNYSVEFQ